MHRLVATRKFAIVLPTVAVVVTTLACGGAPGTSSPTQPATNGRSRAVVIADFSEPSILPVDAGIPPMPYREAIDGLATSRSSLDCRSGRYARYQGALDGSFTSKSKQQLLLWVGDECDIPVAKWAPLLEGAVVERGRVVARFTSDRFSIQSIADVDHDGLDDLIAIGGYAHKGEVNFSAAAISLATGKARILYDFGTVMEGNYDAPGQMVVIFEGDRGPYTTWYRCVYSASKDRWHGCSKLRDGQKF